MNIETRETLLWIFCIVIVIVLAGKIGIEAKDYDCSKCEVNLYNKIVGSEYHDLGEFSIKELYEEYKDGHCAIVWSPTQGYHYNG